MSKKTEKEFVDRMLYVLKAPIIVFKGQEDTVTEEMKTKANLERLSQNIRDSEKEECTDYEAMLYISSASLVAPMSHEWAVLYTHLFLQVYPEHSELQEGVEKPHEYELGLLKDLKAWIYKKQVQALKDKVKAVVVGGEI